jgi:glycosyltransferase involved in cell wall biosynthesis
LKLFEYMAAGRPMVVSDLPVLHEVLGHGANAWLVRAADGAAIAEGVKTLLDQPGLASALARRARSDAPQYVWSRRARTIADFLERRPWQRRRERAGSGRR